jgi:hypothetical protein
LTTWQVVNRKRFARAVGEDGVDLPGSAVVVGDPGLVLRRVAAVHALLGRHAQPLARQPAPGGDDLVGGGDLDAEVVERAGGRRVLDRTSSSGGLSIAKLA